MSGPIPGVGAVLAGFSFNSYSTEYTATGDQTIAVPNGASSVDIECIGPGGGGYTSHSTPTRYYGGGGGGYAKKVAYSVIGVSALWISVPVAPPPNGGSTKLPITSSTVRAETSTGTILCNATSGTEFSDYGSGTVGDILYHGGTGMGGRTTQSEAYGGGAAGPLGNGGNAAYNAYGTSGGSPAGDGGQDYGGGNHGGYTSGRQGYIRLTWH